MKKILFIFIFFYFSSCKEERKSFCSEKFGADYIRIPLKEPYELIKLSGRENWCLNYAKNPDKLFPKSAVNITEVNVHDGIIFLYCDGFLDSFYPSEKFFYGIIDAQNSKEEFYDTKAEYDSVIKSMGFIDVKLLQINNVWNTFVKYDSVEWCK